MDKLHTWFGGKTHFWIVVCTLIGCGAFLLCWWKNQFTGLEVFLGFLVCMSGVQAGRSAIEDWKPK